MNKKLKQLRGSVGFDRFTCTQLILIWMRSKQAHGKMWSFFLDAVKLVVCYFLTFYSLKPNSFIHSEVEQKNKSLLIDVRVNIAFHLVKKVAHTHSHTLFDLLDWRTLERTKNTRIGHLMVFHTEWINFQFPLFNSQLSLLSSPHSAGSSTKWIKQIWSSNHLNDLPCKLRVNRIQTEYARYRFRNIGRR